MIHMDVHKLSCVMHWLHVLFIINTFCLANQEEARIHNLEFKFKTSPVIGPPWHSQWYPTTTLFQPLHVSSSHPQHARVPYGTPPPPPSCISVSPFLCLQMSLHHQMQRARGRGTHFPPAPATGYDTRRRHTSMNFKFKFNLPPPLIQLVFLAF